MIPIIYNEEFDRWFRGDRHVRTPLRKLIRGKPKRLSGMQTVVNNFLRGLDSLGVDYQYNRRSYSRSQPVISFGLGMKGLEKVHPDTPTIAAIGFPPPHELPNLCTEYNIKKYLQHSQWILDFAKSAQVYNDEIFDLWPAGIDTDFWFPRGEVRDKSIDVLIYNKIRWDKESVESTLLQPIRDFLSTKGYTFAEIDYGNHFPEGYRDQLNNVKTLIFLSAHESQGLAYLEALSCGVPVIAWNPGSWLDPDRLKLTNEIVPATSVPFFDERCGTTFKDITEFDRIFVEFFERASADEFASRDYVCENLTIEKTTRHLLDIYESVN